MKLEIEATFNSPKYAETFGLIDYKAAVKANDGFEHNDYENQAYALRLLNDEFKAAVKRVNKQLLAEGFGKESFRKPIMMLDENGNAVDVNVY